MKKPSCTSPQQSCSKRCEDQSADTEVVKAAAPRRCLEVESISCSKAYRLHFSCHNIGKYMRRSKRRIKWGFGFTNVSSVREGKRGIDCRGEEHEVELVLSSNSSKARVFWNKRNITHLFHEGCQSGKFEFTWQSRSGERFEAVAHTNPVQGEPQYDFFVDGIRFSELPDISELGFELRSEDIEKTIDFDFVTENEVEGKSQQSINQCSDRDVGSGFASGPDIDMEDSPEDLGFRLSMIGLSPSGQEEIVDELRSDLYSSTLDSLRSLVKECIPQTEEMVSLAIINAFNCDDADSQTSLDSWSESSVHVDAMQLEVDAIRDSYEWITLNKDYAPRPDVEEQSLSFLQTIVNSVVFHIRYHMLPAKDAFRILVTVSLMLGVIADAPLDTETLIFDRIDKSINLDDFRNALSRFGELADVALAESGGFGICRFVDTTSITAVVNSAHRNLLFYPGSEVNIIALSSYSRHQEENRSVKPCGFEMTLQSEDRDASPTMITPEHFRVPECSLPVKKRVSLHETHLTRSIENKEHPPVVETAVVTPTCTQRPCHVGVFAEF